MAFSYSLPSPWLDSWKRFPAYLCWNVSNRDFLGKHCMDRYLATLWTITPSTRVNVRQSAHLSARHFRQRSKELNWECKVVWNAAGLGGGLSPEGNSGRTSPGPMNKASTATMDDAFKRGWAGMTRQFVLGGLECISAPIHPCSLATTFHGCVWTGGLSLVSDYFHYFLLTTQGAGWSARLCTFPDTMKSSFNEL